ncbi:MAG: nucleoside triphosphate pyrophosphohydrolase [Anaerolineaceae bacterium]|nr:nucleoside triphosphate pyrophosphohydrolase [Anaerolineaceae bacterium]MBN2676520.1 nucleoside triphosphate pyrophosphohydrolase [Anaerolineaceae bacterium]
MSGITLLGLGPGDPKYITREALDWLKGLSEVYLIDDRHPALTVFPTDIKINSLFSQKGETDTGEEQINEWIDRLLELSCRPAGLTLATTGHPCQDSRVGREVYTRAKALNIPINVIAGLSWNEMVLQMTENSNAIQCCFIDAQFLAKHHMPFFPPSQPAVISHINSRDLIARVKDVLLRAYPPVHPLIVIKTDELTPAIDRMPLTELEKYPFLSGSISLYIEAMSENTAFERFQDVVARLRAPDGCPWDREQTHVSLRQHLLEESYETLEAIDSGSMKDLCEELGDLLLQIVLNTQIASENHHFNMTQVIEGICSKIIYRHPHVFDGIKVEGVGAVLKNWEKIKEEERQKNGNQEKGLLSGAPISLPALAYANDIQDRAARVGFDWPGIDGVIDKVNEELQEVLSAGTDKQREDEIGDLEFAVVNLARWLKVDPESALRGTNQRFKQRFSYIEKAAREKNIPLGDMAFKEMDRLWEEAKGRE